MNRIFRGFCINHFGKGPSHYISSCSDFCSELSEIFIFKKQLPVSVSWGVDKIAWSIHFFQTFKYFYCDSTLHPWLIFGQIDPLKACFNRLKYWKSKLNNFFLELLHRVSTIREVVDSPTQRYSESSTLRICDTRSRWLSDSTIQGVGDSPYH